MNTVNSLEGLIDKDIIEILVVIEDIASRNEGNIAELKELIMQSRFSNKYEILNVSDKNFVRNIIMCLLLSSIDPFVVNAPLMTKHYQEKVTVLCEKLGLQSSSVIAVSSIEKKLQSLLF